MVALLTLFPLTFHWYAGARPPLTAVAINVTAIPGHTGLSDATIDTLTGSCGVTCITITFDVAGFPDEHTSLDVRTQLTIFPLAGTKVYVAFVALLTLLPFTFHWYAGAVPPFTAVAVNVTEPPEQTGFAEAVMVTLTGNTGFTVIVRVFDVAGLPVAQVALDVSEHVTVFPFAGTKV